MLNNQPPEKSRNDSGHILEIRTVFPTIQGEGPYTGRPAIFIRLAGCNLQCPWCDTDYTSVRSFLTLEEIVDLVNSHLVPEALVVITGGEPFRQNITPITSALCQLGYDVQVETNGTLPPSPGLHPSVMVVCSPKTGKINPLMQKRANCFKYVLASDSVDPDDGLPTLALGHTARPRVGRPPVGSEVPIYLQPMDSYDKEENERNVQAVVESCMRYGYTLQLQIHKLVGVE